MSLDFQQVREQIKQMGESAPQRAKLLKELRQIALKVLRENANDLAQLHQKIKLVADNYDPNLRCALPVPEFPENVNRDELGDLGLTDEEEAAIVAFLKTLSDGFQP